jgi:cyclophilin family peptidyl-prolyl cis-trans isomerase
MMKRNNLVSLLSIIVYFIIIMCGNAYAQNNSKRMDIIKIKTDFGDIFIWLYDETPKHKNNFLKLAREGFYNGTTFHRVIHNFMIQGGDPLSKDDNPYNDGTGGPGYEIDAEIFPAIKHVYGSVAAARNNNPQKRSSGSQFYIVQNQRGTPHLDGDYSVFGQVIQGMETVEKIAVQKTGQNNRPVNDIKMTVTVEEYTAAELKEKFAFEPK